MVRVHTYRVVSFEDTDYYQFYERWVGDTIAIHTHDLPIGILCPLKRRGRVFELMHGLIKQHHLEMGVPVHVKHEVTVDFEEMDVG